MPPRRLGHVEEPGEAEERRERRRVLPALAFSWGFLALALLLAAVILLVVYLTGAFGEGGEERSAPDYPATASSTEGTSPQSSSSR